MSANASLWGALESALASSAWFVLIADPHSATSEYVQQEVSWWLSHRGTTPGEASRRVLIVLADGDLVWHRAAGRFDAARSTAIPAVLADAYLDEPRWVDMRWYTGATSGDPRFVDAVADISAAVREQPKEELVGENVRQHRRTRRITRVAIASLVALALAAASSAGIAVVQRNHAVANATIADARYLSNLARDTIAHDANAARQIAARAYLLDPTAASEASLFAALIDSGQVATLSALPSAATALAASSDGSHVVAGLEDGTVLLVDVDSGGTRVIGTVGGEVDEVSVDDAGSLVAASTRDQDTWRRVATLFDGEGDVVTIPGVPSPSFLRIAPDGGAVLVGGYPDDTSFEHGVGVFQPASGTLDSIDTGEVLVGDDEVLDLGFGFSWSVVDLATGAIERTESYGFGAKQGLIAAPDGSAVAMVGGGAMVPVWRTGPGEGDGYVEDASCPVDTVVCEYWGWTGSFPDGFASGPMEGDFVLSADGSSLAWAQGSTVSVSPVLGLDEAMNLRDRLIEVEGLGSVAALTFVGDRLVAATSAGLVLIDPGGVSPLVSSTRTYVGTACTTCGLRDVALSPDGTWLASGFWGAGMEVQSLVDDRRLELEGQDLHPVAWLDDGSLVVVDLQAEAVERVSVGDALVVEQSVRLPGLDNLAALGMIMGGPITASGAVRFVTGAGEVWTLDPVSLEVLDRRVVAEFADYTIDGPGPASSPNGRYAVGGGYLVDLDTGAATALGLDSGDLVTIDAIGPLVITDAAIEQFDTAMRLVSTVPVAQLRREESIAVDPSGTWLVSITADDTMTVRHLSDGDLVGTLPLESSIGGTARLDFDEAGSVHLLRTVGADLLATEQTLLLDPSAWLDAVCTAHDYTPLSAADWQLLAHMDPPADDLCA